MSRHSQTEDENGLKVVALKKQLDFHPKTFMSKFTNGG